MNVRRFLKVEPGIGHQARWKTGNLKLLEETINTDVETGMRKPRGRRVAILRGKDGMIRIRKEREELPAKKVVVDGVSYVRCCGSCGNRSMERLLRNADNLEKFIAGLRKVIWGGMESGKLLLGDDFPSPKNDSLDYVRRLCYDVDDGLLPDGFTGRSGKPIMRNRAFQYMILQFFADAYFAQEVCGQAVKDRRHGLFVKNRK